MINSKENIQHQRICELKKECESYKTTKNHLLELFEIQSRRIIELEKQLTNSIRPKFKLGEDIFVFDYSCQLRTGKIFEIQTNQTRFTQPPLITYMVDYYGAYSDDDQENDYFEEKDIFATKEEAQAKLEELQGENK